jgi:hypothetical protein
MLLMPMLYLPPIAYMALLHAAGEVCIEAQENYIKSCYRNRCEVMGPNGIIDLSIPVRGGRDHHQLYMGTAIAYDSDWQHRHYMSILSCYGSAPFYEHYMSYLKPFYEKKHTNLFEYNKELLELLIRLLKLEVKLTYTDMYEKHPDGKTDLRNTFKPGRSLDGFIMDDRKWYLKEVSYMRVFDSEDHSLNISSLDLLFNEGPQSKNILQQMIVAV